MSKFTEGMNVVVITNNSVVEGKIREVFDEVKIIFVDRPNGEVLKVPFDRVGIVEKKATVEEDVPTEPEEEVKEESNENEDPTVMIARSEFILKCAEVCSEIHLGCGVMFGNFASSVSARITAKLFPKETK